MMSLGLERNAGQWAKEPAKLELVSWNGAFSHGWQKINRLIGEQKKENRELVP
jgi:hypothetical protein